MRLAPIAFLPAILAVSALPAIPSLAVCVPGNTLSIDSCNIACALLVSGGDSLEDVSISPFVILFVTLTNFCVLDAFPFLIWMSLTPNTFGSTSCLWRQWFPFVPTPTTHTPRLQPAPTMLRSDSSFMESQHLAPPTVSPPSAVLLLTTA